MMTSVEQELPKWLPRLTGSRSAVQKFKRGLMAARANGKMANIPYFSMCGSRDYSEGSLCILGPVVGPWHSAGFQAKLHDAFHGTSLWPLLVKNGLVSSVVPRTKYAE